MWTRNNKTPERVARASCWREKVTDMAFHRVCNHLKYTCDSNNVKGRRATYLGIPFYYP